MVKYGKLSILGILILISLASCDLRLNGRSGYPGYLNYVSETLYLADAGLVIEPDPESSLVFRSVTADSFLAADGVAFPGGLPASYLVLGFREQELKPYRALVFNPALEPVLDSRDWDDELGSFNEYVLSPSSWTFRQNGGLDLGRMYWYAPQPDQEINPLYGGGRWSELQSFVSAYDSVWRDYLTELYFDDASGNLQLVVTASQERGLDPVYNSWPPTVFVNLIPDMVQRLDTELRNAGLGYLSQDRRLEWRLATIVPDRSNDRILVFTAFGSDGITLFYTLSLLPYADLNTMDPSPAQPYPLFLIPGGFRFDRMDFQLRFDGEYLLIPRVADPFDEYHDQPILLDLYLLEGSGWDLSLDGATSLRFLRSLDYGDLFHDMRLGRDFDITPVRGAGEWYLINRETLSISRLNLGEGGWE